MSPPWIPHRRARARFLSRQNIFHDTCIIELFVVVVVVVADVGNVFLLLAIRHFSLELTNSVASEAMSFIFLASLFVFEITKKFEFLVIREIYELLVW